MKNPLHVKEAGTVVFTGYSDDLIHCVTPTYEEEYNPRGSSDGYMGHFVVVSPEGSAKVHVVYDGQWSFAYGLVDEGTELPNWSTTFQTGDRGYQAEFHLGVPANTTVLWVAGL